MDGPRASVCRSPDPNPTLPPLHRGLWMAPGHLSAGHLTLTLPPPPARVMDGPRASVCRSSNPNPTPPLQPGLWMALGHLSAGRLTLTLPPPPARVMDGPRASVCRSSNPNPTLPPPPPRVMDGPRASVCRSSACLHELIFCHQFQHEIMVIITAGRRHSDRVTGRINQSHLLLQSSGTADDDQGVTLSELLGTLHSDPVSSCLI